MKKGHAATEELKAAALEQHEEDQKRLWAMMESVLGRENRELREAISVLEGRLESQ
jgi:hypothetical protein